MRDTHVHSVGHALEQLRAGNRAGYDELFPLVYDELHRIAAGQRRRWTGDETLTTTAVVNEVYLKLVDQSAPDWRNRAHFLAVASTAMRQILIDYAKRKRTAKRGAECRFFGAMSIEDTAEAIGVSPATVKRGWAMAQAWLYRDLKRTAEEAL